MPTPSAPHLRKFSVIGPHMLIPLSIVFAAVTLLATASWGIADERRALLDKVQHLEIVVADFRAANLEVTRRLGLIDQTLVRLETLLHSKLDPPPPLRKDAP